MVFFTPSKGQCEAIFWQVYWNTVGGARVDVDRGGFYGRQGRRNA